MTNEFRTDIGQEKCRYLTTNNLHIRVRFHRSSNKRSLRGWVVLILKKNYICNSNDFEFGEVVKIFHRKPFCLKLIEIKKKKERVHHSKNKTDFTNSSVFRKIAKSYSKLLSMQRRRTGFTLKFEKWKNDGKTSKMLRV